MPGWSPEIANEFVLLSLERGRPLDQLQLQALVYIAHGWCLATQGQPLTGDRPEASPFGPVYARLATALSAYGRAKILRLIRRGEAFGEDTPGTDCPARSDLDGVEVELIKTVDHNYGAFESWQLSALTRKGDTPWAQIFRASGGSRRDIPHNLIKAQFVEILRHAD